MKGVDDLDFFIGDEAIEKPTYATKVRTIETNTSKYCGLLMDSPKTEFVPDNNNKHSVHSVFR